MTTPVQEKESVAASAAGGVKLTSTELAHKIVDLVEEKQASNIALLDLRQISVLADYFVICTSESERQTAAIVESVAIDLKHEGVRPLHPAEGGKGAGWTLLDFADVVVHVFDPTTRQFYNLEELWKDAPVVVKIQ